jgi:hypothetical protein
MPGNQTNETEQTKKTNKTNKTQPPRESTSKKERKPKWVASGSIKRSIWMGKNRKKNQVEGRRRRE